MDTGFTNSVASPKWGQQEDALRIEPLILGTTIPSKAGSTLERAYYSSNFSQFIGAEPKDVLHVLVVESTMAGFPPEHPQLLAWEEEIRILKGSLQGLDGRVYLEFSIPRMGLRADVVLLIGSAVIVVEFKVGEKSFPRSGIEQVWDYALDLKNFHDTSHGLPVVPVLVATRAKATPAPSIDDIGDAVVSPPLCVSASTLPRLLEVLANRLGGGRVDPVSWENGHYSPTPTIIEAALALYKRHTVEDISRSDASASNLTSTSETVERIVRESQAKSKHSICFVTGVPGAGKTLAGLNLATKFLERESPWHSVYLSGNGPLVQILVEALARDRRDHLKASGGKAKIGSCRSDVKAFIQNVHHFRDEYLQDEDAPHEHVTIFDEAQRAWTRRQSANFMKRRRGRRDFPLSEPGFLISCLNRHKDWATIVCLVGGGQEINTGEAGIGEWLDSIHQSFPGWEVHISDSARLTEWEYGAGSALERLRKSHEVRFHPELHLGVSLRSFRAEHVSNLVSEILAIKREDARRSFDLVPRYPIRITRSLEGGKEWVRRQARGSERYGMVVSSRAERLKPHAIDVRAKVNPIHWFLDDREDTRSSLYLEDAASEFQVQGLELDWTCVVWDADLRFSESGWKHFEFRGRRWQRIKAEERKRYLENTYRVLLTRARQGMVIVVPPGEVSDPTRCPGFYDPTFAYLSGIGIPVI